MFGVKEIIRCECVAKRTALKEKFAFVCFFPQGLGTCCNCNDTASCCSGSFFPLAYSSTQQILHTGQNWQKLVCSILPLVYLTIAPSREVVETKNSVPTRYFHQDQQFKGSTLTPRKQEVNYFHFHKSQNQ